MRKILFRGKTKDTKWWIEGYYAIESNHACFASELKHTHFIFKDEFMDWNIGGLVQYEVIPESIGQYTGLTDKNGKKIFEGDIVKNDWCFMCGNSVIKFGQYKPLDMGSEYQQGHLGFYLEHIHKADKRRVRKDIMYFANNCEVIGNIHDNPELLKGGAE